MQRAGAAAAAEIALRFARASARCVIATGPGNNGGDGWVVARALHAPGSAYASWNAKPARTPDAVAERDARDRGRRRRYDEWTTSLAGGERSS